MSWQVKGILEIVMLYHTTIYDAGEKKVFLQIETEKWGGGGGGGGRFFEVKGIVPNGSVCHLCEDSSATEVRRLLAGCYYYTCCYYSLPAQVLCPQRWQHLQSPVSPFNFHSECFSQAL